MLEKHNISISNRLYEELKEYCKYNGLKLNSFVESLIRTSFNVEKYGETPFKVTVKADDEREDYVPVTVNVRENNYIDSVTLNAKINKDGTLELDDDIEDKPESKSEPISNDNMKEPEKVTESKAPVVNEKPIKTKKITRLN